MLRLHWKWMLAGLGLGLLSTAGYAFQETTGVVAPGQQSAPVVANPGASGASGLDVRNTGVSVAEPSGVEVRIPGLGKLGVLPKFDFGLELLYGVNEAKPGAIDNQLPQSPADDVQIRGSLKHRF